MTHTTGNILPVQISANIVLVLSKASVVISEAKTCSNLKKKCIQTSSTAHIHSQNALTGCRCVSYVYCVASPQRMDTHRIVNVQNGISQCPGIIPQTNCRKQVREVKRGSGSLG